MTRDREEKDHFSRGHSSGSGKSSGNGGSGGKDKMAIRHRHSDGSGNDSSPRHHSDDRHRTRRTTRKGLRIFVGTANLSQAIPDEESLAAFLPNKGKAAYVLNSDVKSSSVVDGVSKKDFNQVDRHGKVEVLVLGFQECLESTVANGLSTAFGGLLSKKGSTDVPAGNTSTKELDAMINAHVGDDYTLMMERLHADMLVYIYVRSDLASSASVTETHVQTSRSKGCSIASTLIVGGTKLSFICMQLKDKEQFVPRKNSTISAGKKATLDQKNATAEEFLSVAGKDPSLSSHHIFVFGDLNYRVSPPSNTRGVTNTFEEEQFIARNMLTKKDWSSISDSDELVQAMKNNDALSAFTTPFCKFHPTYKMQRAAGIKYDYSSMPSYADRILVRSNQEGSRKVEAIVYEPIHQFSTSLHKPMRGLFFLPDRKIHFDPNNEPKAMIITFTHLKGKKLRPKEDILHSDINPYLQFCCDARCVKMSKSSKDRTETTYTTDRPTWPTQTIRYRVDLSSSKRHGDEIKDTLLHIKCMNEGIRGATVLGTAVIDLANVICKSVTKEEWQQREVETYFYRGGRQTGKLYYNIKVRWEENE
eukprot:scaffold4387_cov124-Skeletonema_dohrnii-CCMP3373.AAC.4